MSSSKSTEEELKFLMFVMGHHRLNWPLTYLYLRKAAKILLDESKSETFGEPNLGSASTLLLAFAFECLIKGRLVFEHEMLMDENGLLKEKFKTHKLRKLAEYAKLDLPEDELKILDFLTQYLEWRGRYPMPARWEALHDFFEVDVGDVYEVTNKVFTICDRIDLKVARKLCRSFSLLKKQWLTSTIKLQNRCTLRQRPFHLPAAYPRIDLASLIQTDPQRFWITGRLSLVYHR